MRRSGRLRPNVGAPSEGDHQMDLVFSSPRQLSAPARPTSTWKLLFILSEHAHLYAWERRRSGTQVQLGVKLWETSN